MPGNRLREVPVGLLDQQAILKIEHIAVEGEPVGIARGAEQKGRLADQVEREVGEADIDFEHRRMAAPLAEPLAEDQRVVAEAQQILRARVQLLPGGGRRPGRCGSSACALLGPGLRRGTPRHMCFTSSGMS